MSDARDNLFSVATDDMPVSGDEVNQAIDASMREVQWQTLLSASRALEDPDTRRNIVQEMADRHPNEDPGAMLSGLDGASWYLKSVAADMWITETGG